jgi:hypothetical protein
MTTIKAWAFMADSEKGKYFIENSEGKSDIYLKKPKAQPNPFDYSGNPKNTWEPTEMEITIKD